MNSSSKVSHLQPLCSDKVELHPSVSAQVSCGLHIPNSQAAGLFVSSVHDKKFVPNPTQRSSLSSSLKNIIANSESSCTRSGRPFHPQILSNENFDSLNYNADDVTPVDSFPRFVDFHGCVEHECSVSLKPTLKSFTSVPQNPSHYTHKHHPLQDIHGGRRKADVGVAVKSTDVSRAVCESPRIRIDDGYHCDSAVAASGEPKTVGTTSEYEVIDSGAVSSDRAVTPPVGTPIASSSPVSGHVTLTQFNDSHNDSKNVSNCSNSSNKSQEIKMLRDQVNKLTEYIYKLETGANIKSDCQANYAANVLPKHAFYSSHPTAHSQSRSVLRNDVPNELLSHSSCSNMFDRRQSISPNISRQIVHEEESQLTQLNYPTVTTLNDSFESCLVGSKKCHVNNSYAHNMVTSSQQMFSQNESHHAHPLLNSGPGTRYFAGNIADCTSESVHCAGIDYENENCADRHILASQSQPFGSNMFSLCSDGYPRELSRKFSGNPLEYESWRIRVVQEIGGARPLLLCNDILSI